MKTKSNKPEIGQTLTMALDYWRDDAKKGSPVTVIKSRKDKKCASGLRVFVKTSGGKVLELDARWFKEYDDKFTYSN
jgi:hypothetical protein